MSSATSEFPPVAKLCSNCQKAQFRDDSPQLFQDGSHLKFDKDQLPQSSSPCGIFATEFKLVDSFPELPKLLESSQNGCDFCRFLHHAIILASSDRKIDSGTQGQGRLISVAIHYLWGPLQEDLISKIKDSYKWPIGLNSMCITCDDKSDNEFAFTLDCEVQSLCHSDSVSQWLRLGSRAYPSYCDADSVCWMKERLESCKKEHDHGVFDQRYVPERLIDVSDDVPRLKLRKDILPLSHIAEFKYATLSYCWGSGVQAKTTADTLQDRQAGISEPEMPRVLRDAIQVTRALGIPFLWMDALCILQDDPSDWEQHCTEMHNIYGSAHVTLCVANSCSCNEGFLQQTVPCVRLPFQSLQAPNMEGSFLVQCNEHRPGIPEGYSEFIEESWELEFSEESWELEYNDVHRSYWKQRGWVLQEDQLSTRKLIFGRSNLYFVSEDITQARGKCGPPDSTRHISTILAQESPEGLYRASNSDVLHNYCLCAASSFTYATDILPAISGLASLYGERLKDSYYAGHWGRALYRTLSWRGSKNFSLPLQPAEVTIPSWTRLAKGYVETYAYDYSSTWLDVRSEINIPRTRVVTVGKNSFGALKECRLWIRGYTLDMDQREVQVSSEPRLTTHLGQYHLVVHGRCFGHPEFDWQAGEDDLKKKRPSKEDFRELKLLVLGSFNDDISSIHRDNETIPNNKSSEAYEDCVDSKEGCEEGCGQEQTSDEETSIAVEDVSGHCQSQETLRRGYGLIISPTGNDGEFRRVGLIYAQGGSLRCKPHGDGDIRALENLAKVETIQLV